MNGYPPYPNGVQREAQDVYKDRNFSVGYSPNSTNGGFYQQNSTFGIHGSGQDWSSSNGNYPIQTNQAHLNGGRFQQNQPGLSANNVGVQGGVSPSLMPTSGRLDNQFNKGEVVQFLGTFEELDAYCKEKKIGDAIEVLKILENRGIGLDLARYLSLIQACKDVGDLKYAKFVHNHIMRWRGYMKVSDHNKILEMYFKCGYVSEARELFENMPERNLTSWDTMITNLARNGHGEDAIDIFTEFIKAGLRPDGQMFMGVFLACSVVCDVYEGMIHFESMSREYGVVPSMEHYVSVVNMLGSAGYLDEAKEFIEKMPVEPNVEIWETLMNMCRIHGYTELGNHCVDVVNFLDPTRLTEESKLGLLPVKSSGHVMAEVKEKSNTLQDIASKTQQYRAGDNYLPENQMNYAVLKQLSVHMREAGYVPVTKAALHDVEEESKEEVLLAHSEKLAVVHGLMTSPARGTLRIIKNLRICMDCHNAMELISKISGRTLIVRDTKRFHHFQNGTCTCNGFW